MRNSAVQFQSESRFISAGVFVLAVLSACAGSEPKVRIDQDKQTNFADFKSFAWLEVKPDVRSDVQSESTTAQPKPIPPSNSSDLKSKSQKSSQASSQAASLEPPSDKVSSLATRRVRSAVLASLQSKGYTLNEGHPDFRVSCVFNVFERPKESGMRIGLGAGGGSGHVGGGLGFSIPIGKRTETIGAMTLDVIDVARNAQVWTGSYESKITVGGKGDDGGGDRGKVGDEEIQRMVTAILAKFPTHTR